MHSLLPGWSRQAEGWCLLAEPWAVLERRVSRRDFTDQEALAAIIRVAGGTFQLLRLFTQIERMLPSNGRRTVTSEVMATARSSVVSGVPA